MKKIPLKQWLYEESRRVGITPHGVWSRLREGKRHHYDVQLRQVNQRVIYVMLDARKDASV